MAFADRLAISGTCVFFWVEIDGVDRRWFNRAAPTNWISGGAIGGWTYYTTLEPAATWQGLESRVEPFAGVAPAGRLACQFRLPSTAALDSEEAADWWLQYVANDVSRGNVTVLTADLTATATTATVDDASSFASSGRLYVGRETITYTGKTPTTFTGLTRGVNNSQALYHVGSPDQVLESGRGGAYVTDRVISLQGRRVRVYCGTGFIDSTSGDLVAYDAAVSTLVDSRLVFAGFVRDVRFDGALATVEISAESLRSALAQEFATRLPRAAPGEGAEVEQVHIGSYNNRISWAWINEGTPSGGDVSQYYSRVRLQRSDGAGGTENVPDGWYSRATIATYIAFTMGGGQGGNTISNFPDASGDPIVAPTTDALSCSIGEVLSEERGGWYYTLRFEADLTSSDYAHQISAANTPLFNELGFFANAAEFAENTGTRDNWTFTAERLRPIFFMPRGYATGRHIQYRLVGTLPLNTSGVFDDDDAATIPAYCKVGDEIMRFGPPTDSGSLYPSIEILGRGQLGTRPEEIYVEDTRPFETPEIPELVQGVVLPSVSWGRIALQLAIGGNQTAGTFDNGWRGAGAGLDPSIFDTESWLQYGTALRDYAYFEPTSLDEAIANEAIATRCAVVEQDGKIALRPTEPPLESTRSSAVALTKNNLVTVGGPGVKMSLSESRIVNKIIASDIGFNPATGDAREQITWTDATSAGTWQTSSPLKISLRNVAGREEARAIVLGIAQVASASWSRPVYALDLAVALPEVGWAIQVLDEVVITHPLIFDRAAVQRGVTSLSGRVYGVRPTWRGDGISALVRVIAYSTAARYSAYAPTAYVHTLITTSRLQCTDYYDSADDNGLKDVERFAGGYRVRLYKPGGSAGSAESRVVSGTILSGSADSSLLVLTSATALTAPLLVEFSSYGTSSIDDEQLRWVYLSDGDGKLDKSSGSDKPFLYV